MARVLIATVLAGGMGMGVFSGVAHADDAAEVKRLVQAEIKAYMDQKKEADTKEHVFKAKWKDGLVFETPDKQYTLKIGGRIHFDTAFVSASEALQGPSPGLGEEFQDQSYFRRLRLYVSGDITRYVDYKIQLEFADPSDPQVKDAWITLKNLKQCVGCWMPSVRVGQMFECIGLEHQSSSNHIAFIEKSLTNVLSPERALGVQLFDSFWNERAVGQLGLFSTDTSDDEDGFSIWDERERDGGWAVTGRFGLIPWAKDTCRFLHLGVGGSYRTTDEARFRARPDVGRGPRMVDTGALTDVEHVLLGSAEAALVWRSFHVSAEAVVANLSDAARGDPTFHAWYVQAGWFLTGESKAWNFTSAQWGNTRPCRGFLSDDCRGCGAIEFVARYDTVDLNDGTVRGGEMANLALGVNWYLSASVRLMFDVVFSHTQDRSGGGVVIDDENVRAFVVRWDVHF